MIGAAAAAPTKNWQLGGVFLLAVVVFITMRWQPEPWIRAQLMAVAAQQHIQLDYQQLHVRGLTLVLDQVSVHSRRLGQPVTVEKVTVRPQWHMLWSGEPAARLGVEWQGQRVQASVVQRDGYVELSDMDMHADIAVLQQLWRGQLALPVDVVGQVSLSGALKLDARSGQPLAGHLIGTWKGAAATLSGIKLPLGDYQISLQPASQAGSWQWQADGGSGIVLQAEGKLILPGGDPRMWRISGTATMQAGDVENPLVSGILGDQPVKFRLAGSLVRPQLQRLQ